VKALRFVVIAAYLAVGCAPLIWLVATSVKSRQDSISQQLKFVPTTGEPAANGSAFPVTADGYRRLSEKHSGLNHNFYHFLGNSLVIAAISTLASVLLGTFCGYGFSRFEIAGAKDWLFFILSTRFLPPLAVVVPIWIMWVEFSLNNTRLGLIILYTGFNLSLSVWLMKGFIDDIPRAYEEAALVDGYSRLHAFFYIILPQAATGMAVTAVFCLIAAWNEYGFAMTLNSRQAVRTVPPYFAGLQGNISGIPWPQVAAGTLLFVLPIIVFTVLVRRHLLRGVTFGTIKQ
jgi:multiple sugar transport system permease protein